LVKAIEDGDARQDGAMLDALGETLPIAAAS